MAERMRRYLTSLSTAAGEVLWSGGDNSDNNSSEDQHCPVVNGVPDTQDFESPHATAPPDPDDEIPLLQHLRPVSVLPSSLDRDNLSSGVQNLLAAEEIKSEINESPGHNIINGGASMVPRHEASQSVVDQSSNPGAQALSHPGQNHLNTSGSQSVQPASLSLYPPLDYTSLGARPKVYRESRTVDSNANLSLISESLSSNNRSGFDGFDVPESPPNTLNINLDPPPSYHEACLSPNARAVPEHNSPLPLQLSRRVDNPANVINSEVSILLSFS